MLKTGTFALITIFAATPAFASILGPAQNYNVFVFGNMTQSSDSQGALAVGGNASLSSYSVATNATSSATNLVVGGNLTASYGTINGNAIVGGNVDYNDPSINGSLTAGGTVNYHTSGGSVTGGTYSVGSYTGLSYISHTTITGPVSLPINFSSAQSILDNTADSLAGLSSTGITAISYGAVTFTGANAATNIFTISAAQLSSVNGITINIPGGADALINVTGAGSISLPNVGFNFDASRTLWNLDAFTTVSTSSFSGSVLAPYANVTYHSGAFNGTLVADSVIGGGQFNQSSFTYDIPIGPTPGGVLAPEPASLALLGAGSMLLLRRRKA
jgi:choice-of-anchor A domain-containing protein